ncbi:ATP-dependent DNA helicase Q4 [Wyeomyia smithii]|uniref:ATP-dependent DNA helicase Q4 n=1 Tax=Wyeomyia smithii TaxID=174621 RepID=UPI00246820E6|nr:ATP-dependent DNA helicase Q4 [Wyeomyia smithii]
MDPAFRSRYQKCKYKVKLWEKEFRKKNGRIPSKHDIRDAKDDVREAYKMYYKLKTSLLENTLQDVLGDEDDFDSSLVSQMESGLSQDCSVADSSFSNLGELKASNVSISNLLTDQIAGHVSEFEAEQELEQNVRAWGKELNKKKSTVVEVQKKSSVKPRGKTLIKQLIDVSSMVPSRNPRKSISSRLSSSTLSSASGQTSFGSGSWKDALPDLETLLNEKSKQAQQTSPVQVSTLSQQSKIPVNQLDEGWLNRQSGTQGDVVNPEGASQPKKYGLGNISLSKLDSSNTALVDVSSSFGLSALSMNSFSSNTQIIAQSTALDRSIQSDSDGVVENSEDELVGANGSLNNTTNIRHVTKKRKVFSSLNVKAEKKETEAVVPVTMEQTGSEKQVDAENLDPTETAAPKKHETQPTRGRKKGPAKTKPATAKVPIRKLPARGRKSVSYKVQNASEDEAVADAFEDFDDDDKDPDFVSKKENPSDVDSNDDNTADVSSAAVEPEEVKRKGRPRKSRSKNITNTSVSPSARGSSRKRRSGSAKKSPAAPRIGGNIGKGKRKITKQARGRPVKKVQEEMKQEEPEEFNEYVLEFGIESLSNVPRIELNELKMQSAAAENFIQGAIAEETATKSKSDRNLVSNKEAILKKKAAAGKLNENFVRIDIRKKVYVKGKKTVNFSKYKKAQWKKKKIAAMSGPEMDMGGCDGGVLTCFQCGGVGHMARNCKVRGEQLLPLDAAEADESPFPTLEEAESMAKAKSLVVHANRMQNLPIVDNPTWKADETEGSSNFSEGASNESERCKDPYHSPEKSFYIRHTIPEDFLKTSGILEYTVGSKDKIEPLYQLQPDGVLPATPREVFEALKMFGHKQFRAGQEKAIMRVLTGMSTLVTLSTGSGKSLCYQLPAYLYRKQRKCVTLVISPLVSLMEDQVHGVPDFLNAQCLHTNQTPKVREKTMAAITSGELDVLLISPEAVVSGEKSTGFGSLLRQLPPIAFACIDEAHCVSQWSHNFRPSYLMICRVLKEKLGVHTILGLTATATVQTRLSIVDHLAIPDGTDGIISDIPLPDNLILSVSKDANRDAALLNLLHSDRFSRLQSIIVYCTRRDECERIAAFLRTCFQDMRRTDTKDTASGAKKRKRENCIAEPYHAGLPSSRRKSIQNAFMRGDLRIVVATIAFGMGINKSDIRAIIHYNMPRNFESYVQEVGRAGRDGDVSHCHLFLDCKGNDRNELRRHIYANSIDRHVIRKLLQKIFVSCACVKNFRDEKFSEEHRKQVEALKDIDWSEDFHQSAGETKPTVPKKSTIQRVCPGHEVCFSIESTVQQLDIPEENISTLLCYLELHEERYIQVLSRAYVMCKVMSYAGPRALRAAAKDCPPLAMAIALDLRKGNSNDAATFIEFHVIDVAAAIGWDSGVVKFQLKNLEWVVEKNVRKRSPISVSFFDLGFRMRAPGDLSDDELDTNLDSLYRRVTNQEKTQLIQLQCVFDALSSVAFPSYVSVGNTEKLAEPSNKLKTIIRAYFEDNSRNDNTEFVPEVDDTPEYQLLGDIRSLIQRYPENNFTGRAIARIFHGVQSPNFPAVIWGRCNYWRAHTAADFNRIVRLANTEIVRMRT